MSYSSEIKEYSDILFGEQGIDGRKYLQDRFINVSTAKFWQLGFSPKNFCPECYKNTDHTFWKKMNGRITIPVYNSNGEVIGISGRSIYDDITPKYMHYVFPTRSTLFGLWQNAKDIVRENAVVFTEGQFDVITAWQRGLRICVCTFGAHCSEAQYALAARYTSRIAIMYDQDQAGRTGTTNALEKNNTYGEVFVKSIQGLMKNNEDLDSWIKTHTPERVLKIINYSELDYLKNTLRCI